MRIAVCVKQVPAFGDGATDLERGFVIRTGRTRMNPHDASAVAAALAWREQFGGEVEVFSMGPPGAREVVAEALGMGADRGWLLTDPGLAGADTLVTARTLAAGFQAAGGGFDLYVCGLRTTDGDTGQVGPALAALLGRPFIGRVTGWTAERTFRHEVDGWEQTVRADGPAVIAVVREKFPPRVPSLKMKMQKKPLAPLAMADLPEPDPERFGSRGSPTKIRRAYYPERVAGQVRHVDGLDAAALILQAVREL